MRGFDPEKFAVAVDRITPAESWGYYLMLRETGLMSISPREWDAYETAVFRARLGLVWAALLTAVGVGTAAGGVFVRFRSPPTLSVDNSTG